MSNKLCSNKLCRQAKFQINSAIYIATEFIKSNELRYPSPVERLSKINLLCKQKSGKVHSLNSGKVSIQIQLKGLPELSEWTLG